MSSTDLHQTLIQTSIYVLTDALYSDITALENRKQDLLKAEALKWTEKIKNKWGKAAGVLKSTIERRAIELLGVTDQVRGSDLVEGTDLVGETDLVSRLDHPASWLVRKVIACTPPPEDDDNNEDEEKELSQCRGNYNTPNTGKYKKTVPWCACEHLDLLCDYCKEKDLQ
ncbi:hypothetical protein C0995_016556 [Termitomyces sp. Mi166|nr:hypothetical protein C0995_016556 [Termitomyces sp. Mi166\